jgi:hypothetical protein
MDFSLRNENADILNSDLLCICETFILCDNGQYVKGLEDIKSRYSRLTTGGN